MSTKVILVIYQAIYYMSGNEYNGNNCDIYIRQYTVKTSLPEHLHRSTTSLYRLITATDRPPPYIDVYAGPKRSPKTIF